ncbi:probable LRR receptor-like serine/threonine-protein kinase At1g06840 [Camellia sinensis]|uniref:probable LRR receptor-like serine/threonine-protein kinase At1g06840 n=1 Tax=Camellia sinensis TaxID=4442 RepID=UPI0010360F0D|nr:probable LRR receptor-like serine/threonine-protein kinase At1g06840 [Camellia sinensis]
MEEDGGNDNVEDGRLVMEEDSVAMMMSKMAVHIKCLFDEIPVRNVVSWTTMIIGFAQEWKIDLCLELYHRMRNSTAKRNEYTSTAKRNEYTLTSLLSACTGAMGVLDMEELLIWPQIETYAILNNGVHSHAFQFLYAFKDGLNWFVLITFISIAVIPSKSRIGKGALAGIVVGTFAGAVILSAVVSLLMWRLHMNKYATVSKRRRLSKITIKIAGVKDFSYQEMALVTNNFDASSQVGQGRYGKVYKGILADGTVVAIKRALEGSLQGEKEFLTEIELLSRLHHRNLVSLLGFCDEEGEQMLVYEFMSNSALRDHLSSAAKEPPGFAMRLRIALGSSKGILYLHTEADPPIFHRDVKASNILLDSKFTAKVVNFGLSRLTPVPDIQGKTPGHVSTVVKGTPGYVDPEHFLTHKLTDKSDVCSLGVVFLELLTGMHPISHGKNIVRELRMEDILYYKDLFDPIALKGVKLEEVKDEDLIKMN